MAKKKVPMHVKRLMDTHDAAKWRFCIEHGFPRRCFNPPANTHYWYIHGFDPLPECLTWESPVQAVEYAMGAVDRGTAK